MVVFGFARHSRTIALGGRGSVSELHFNVRWHDSQMQVQVSLSENRLVYGFENELTLILQERKCDVSR